ncbi:CheR family methyltransferase [Verrucomicrobium spinosum]|uniref:CheR family methyltransferase n=1 Tax=Verrucomicrobium spinosum TaxID=2736 RepID=UPI0009465B55|nr:protein-glutamate O-methyltransferase CheR [Verrucomicrobium spinosum]
MSAAEPMADPGVSGLLSDPEFQKLKEWIISTTGLSYYADKDRDLATAVGRCQELGGRPAREVLEVLNRRGGPALDRLVEELTIGETFFFRHLEMFHALRDHVLPDLIQRRAALRSIRIWSAGCSVGAEPYSLSILLHDLLGDAARNWSFKIVATDINRRFLALARAGVYDTWALRGMDPALLQRTFHRVGARWRINDLYREAVTFRHHNLVQDKFPSIEHELSGLDLIICRNVIIYFDTATNRRLADQFYRSLVPGGWLAVGHAEPHTEIFRASRPSMRPGRCCTSGPQMGKGAGFFLRMRCPAQPALPPNYLLLRMRRCRQCQRRRKFRIGFPLLPSPDQPLQSPSCNRSQCWKDCRRFRKYPRRRTLVTW